MWAVWQNNQLIGAWRIGVSTVDHRMAACISSGNCHRLDVCTGPQSQRPAENSYGQISNCRLTRLIPLESQVLLTASDHTLLMLDRTYWSAVLRPTHSLAITGLEESLASWNTYASPPAGAGVDDGQTHSRQSWRIAPRPGPPSPESTSPLNVEQGCQ